jgi:hypothetical protein
VTATPASQDVVLPGLHVDDDRRRLRRFRALVFREFDRSGLLFRVASGARRLSNALRSGAQSENAMQANVDDLL